ncbi:MAG: peptidoglycan DD-metalloendopeptidase family protein [Lachnospiraceae bacterium]|nr:peptidoglycan DD-metalloendopeptidase family protein [Lachnospiraceae bacterium]
MKIRRSLRYAVIGISLSFIIAITAGYRVSVLATEQTNDSIKEKESQIESAKSEREQMQSTLSDMKALKEQLESNKSNLETYVTQLDSSLTDIQGKIDDLKQNIEDKETQIDKTEKELDEATAVQQEQYDTMKKRIQFIYERGDSYALEVLVDAGSFGEMLNRAVYISELSDYDNRKLTEFKEQTELVKVTKQALEEERTTLEQAKKDQETEEANMQELITAKTAEIGGVEDDIEGANLNIEEYEAQVAQQNSEIQALEAAVAAEKQRLASANQTHYNGGIFTWPCPNYSYISSEFGYRVHPIYGDTRFHSGLDMAAASGSPILAAYDGTVVAAAYSSSMGNYVMIDHGDGLYTIYMHASALYVSSGQSVTAGEQIAAVGSTGNSTGPHLHFSVRLNGAYVSPWNYLGSAQ